MTTTTTLIRIKRPLGDGSAENIIVSAKRQCLEKKDLHSNDGDCQEVTVMQKLCTLQKQDDPIDDFLDNTIVKNTKYSSYKELKEKYKICAPSTSVIEKQRKDVRSSSAENRFKLICSKRLKEVEDVSEATCVVPKFHMFDAFQAIEATSVGDIIACNGSPVKSEKVEFVYDLYITSVPLEFQSLANNIYEIQYCNNMPMLMHDDSSDNDNYDDEDDSNEEDNWRNDYPEEADSSEDVSLTERLRNTKLSDSDSSYDNDYY